MTETGRIKGISGNIVTIAPERSSACFGCMNHECKTGSGHIIAENNLSHPLKPGQMVEVNAESVSIISQALTAFLPPILCFIAGFALVRIIFSEVSEAIAAFIGLVFFFTAAIIVYYLRKKYPAGNVYTIVRIID
jgi:positive regulator of sigma E activity